MRVLYWKRYEYILSVPVETAPWDGTSKPAVVWFGYTDDFFDFLFVRAKVLWVHL